MTRVEHGPSGPRGPCGPGAPTSATAAAAAAADPVPGVPVASVLTLCTGNAARSVIAGALLASTGPRLEIVTAGTHVVEHQPMSIRTRRAFEHLGIPVPMHRSHQLTELDLGSADLVVAMAAEHVHYVRRRHPGAAGRTATVLWLASHLPPGPEPLAERVAAMDLASVEPEEQGEVDDPAGGEDAAYLACAETLQQAVAALVARL